MTNRDGTGAPAADALIEGVLAAGGAAVSAAHPDLAAPMAGLVTAAVSLVPSLMGRVRGFRHGQAAKAIAAGAANEGLAPEELAERAVRTEFRQGLTADTLEASARSVYDPKVAALGRAWARAVVAEDDATLAQEQQFVTSLARLELPHIRVLGVVATTPSQQRRRPGRAIVYGWSLNDVSQEVPEYGVMTGQLLAVLASEGLIYDAVLDNNMAAGTEYRITGAGAELLQRVADAAEAFPTAERANEARRAAKE